MSIFIKKQEECNNILIIAFLKKRLLTTVVNVEYKL